VISADMGRGRLEPKPRGPTVRKAPLGAPARARAATAVARPPKRTASVAPPPEPSNAARELALGLAAAAIEKKALGIEILDVTGKVDYADFLVVMTGRSDRHVHAIATGIEEAMHKRKRSPLSTEGLAGATWVLLDFGDVVVHVFQEEARAVYDIEGLWIDASRVPVPDADKDPAAPRAPAG
jgi:ribosome-associated protein